MFNKLSFTILTALVLAIGSVSTGFSSPGSGSGNGPGNGAGVTGSLTLAEEQDLLYMREEEKLARDVYAQLYIDYGDLVFDTISKSEQRHMDAMKTLLDKYGLEDPILGPGVFSNDRLTDLWDTLMATAEKGHIWALVVGAWIEETDMVDIRVAIENSEHESIDAVYQSLVCGSQNHLRAFIRNLEANGVSEFKAYGIPLGYFNPDYPDIYFDAEEYWEIADGETERNCSTNHDGRRKGDRNRNGKN